MQERDDRHNEGIFLPKISPSSILEIVIRNNNILNCHSVTSEDTPLKRASMPQRVIIMDEQHDTKSRGRMSGGRLGCNETGKDSQGVEACTKLFKLSYHQLTVVVRLHHAGI